MNKKTVMWGSLLVGLFVAAPASASIFKVGTGTGCTHSTIQAAVNAANGNPGLDHIIVTRSQNYTAQAVKVLVQQPLTISGGYGTCADAQPSGGLTTVSGAGGTADSVFTINTGNAEVLLERLLVRDGDDTETSHGGGIDYTGSGLLSLVDMSITRNSAGYGGGVSAIGSGGPAELLILGNVAIMTNTALRNGGGVHLKGTVTLRMYESNSFISDNQAAGTALPYGYGGGLCAVAPADAVIRSGGFGSLGVISSNRARAGGGVAAMANDSVDGNANIHIGSSDPDRALLINDNFARVAGGAIYADANTSETVFGHVGNGAVYVRNANLIGNTASVGAVVYLASDSSLGNARSGKFYFNSSQDVAPCSPGVSCNLIEGNESRNQAGQRTDGALIHGTEDAWMTIRRAHVTGNIARSFVDLHSAFRVDIHNTLIEGNDFSAAVLQFPTDNDADITLNHLTITDNSIGGAGVIAHRGHVELNRSIIWQPGKKVRDTAASSGTFDGNYVLANETASIPGVGLALYPFNPGFINPTLKDYHLRAGSEAIDTAPYTAALDGNLDLDGLPRSVNLPLVPAGTSVDLGAYERQSINNIMVNDSFNADLSQWTLPYPAIVSRDSNNGNGPSGSGSLKVLGGIVSNAASVTVAKQCQVLPGPGLYRITAWGRSPGAGAITPGDGLTVNWKVFKPAVPAYGCTGPIIDQGDVLIPATTNWMLSPTPGQFGINFDDYLSNAAVEISLVARDVSFPDPQGFRDYNVAFDGITLEANNDLIFANGFD